MRGQCPTPTCNILFAGLYRYGILSNGKNQCLRYKALELQPSHGSDCASSLLFVLLQAPANFADAWKPIDKWPFKITNKIRGVGHASLELST